MGETHVFKTAFSKYFSLAFIAMAIIVSIRVAWVSPRELTQSVPILLAAGGLIGMLFYLPRVEVSDGGITIVNVLRTTHIPWPNFTSVEAQWNLEVKTTDGKYTSWALPASSGTARRLSKNRGIGEDTRPNTAQGAAWVIGERYTALKKAGYLTRKTLSATQVDSTLNRTALVTGAIILVLVGIGIF